MLDPRLIRVGGIGALAVAVTQVGGNALHPPIPPQTAEALDIMARTALWIPVHLDITLSYFLFIPFVIGAAASFRDRPPLVRIATPLIIVGAALGAAQITTHLTIFKYLADRYAATTDPGLRGTIELLYETLWPYSVALEIAHLLVIDVAAVLFGLAMLGEALYPRWVAWLGVVGGIVAAAGLLVGKLVVRTAMGDVIFGVTLIPPVIWIVAVGVVLLRYAPLSPEGATVPRAPARA
jgi:hypothetical protein